MRPGLPDPPRRRRFRWRGFADAGRGLRTLVCTQPNAQVHAVFTAAALGVAAWLGLGAGEWAALLLTTVLVWVAEALNTAVEAVVDLASPAVHPLARVAKDVAAGAVLLAACNAVVVGALLFGPKLWARWSG